MILQNWGDALNSTLGSLWPATIQLIASLIVAIIIFVVGWIIGAFVARLIEQAFKTIKIDHILKQAGLEDALNRGGVKLNSGAFIGGLVKWFIIAVFLLASLQILGLNEVTYFLESIVVTYLPRVIVAVLILLVAVVISDVTQKFVVAAAGAAKIKAAHSVGVVAKWSIIIFAILSALVQLGIAVALIQTIFTGVVAALALAAGLAFGLGGRDAAARTIEKVERELKRE